MNKNFFAKFVFWKKWIFPGMYCYSDGFISQKPVKRDAEICGVVAFKRKHECFCWALRQVELPFSSDGINFCDDWEKLDGYRATKLIAEQAKEQGKRAEAVRFCLDFQSTVCCANEVFLPSKREFMLSLGHLDVISDSLKRIDTPAMDCGAMYWTASGQCLYPVWLAGVGYNFGFGFVPLDRKCRVWPMFRLKF